MLQDTQTHEGPYPTTEINKYLLNVLDTIHLF